MSLDVLTLVWNRAPYEGNTLLTLLALADWSNDSATCWPSLKSLAQKSRQSERNTRYTLRKLETEGFISTAPRYNTSSVYKINIRKLLSCGAIFAPLDDNLGQVDAREGQIEAEKVSQLAPYPSYNHHKEQPSSVTTSKDSFSLTSLDSIISKQKEKQAKEKSDSRHGPVRQAILESYSEFNGVSPQWNGREAKQLSMWLTAHNWPVEKIIECVMNRFHSDENLSLEPHSWIGKLANYANGPLNEFGKPKGVNGNGRLNAAEQRKQSNRELIANAIAERNRTDVGRSGGNLQRKLQP